MPDKPQVMLWAPGRALLELCGVSLLERHLRVLQRLGFSHAFIISGDEGVIRKAKAPPSWARREIRTEARMVPTDELTFGQLREVADRDRAVLLVPANIYCDARLLDALARCVETTALIDSSPPARLRALMIDGQTEYSGAALLDSTFVREGHCDTAVDEAVEREARRFVDAATQPDYVGSMRRHLRPVWFPAPAPENKSRAERVILNSAQKYPALIHSPAETMIVALICRTPITPMQVTFFTFVLGCAVTLAFALGWIWSATLTALFVGILDGVDGKLARVKVETTALGAWEHRIDYLFETFWWLALGYYFYRIGALPWGPGLALVLIGSELLERPFGRRIRLRTGRPPDDVAPIDRAFRCISARRNIFIWMLLLGLIAGRPAHAFVAMCGWQVITTLYVIARWFWICVVHSPSEAIYADAAVLERSSK